MTLAPNGLQNAVAYRWTYADAATRTAATGFAASDVGALALQQDTNVLYLLTATTPTWQATAGGGGGGGLVIAEADGTPSTAATKLILPNGTVSFSGTEATYTPTVGTAGAPTSAPYVTTASDSTLTAAVALPGLAGSADRLGAFGSTIVEDFSTTTEGLTWAPSAPTAHDSNTTIPSWLYARITDGVTRHGKRAFAPAGSFDLRAKMSFGFDGNPGGAATASGGGLCVLDASDNNIFLLQYSVQRDGTSLLGCYTGTGFGVTVSPTTAGMVGTIDLRIARVGTTVLSGYWSTDGLLWTRFGTVTLATTVASAALRIYGAAGTAEMACDWLRATG